MRIVHSSFTGKLGFVEHERGRLKQIDLLIPTRYSVIEACQMKKREKSGKKKEKNWKRENGRKEERKNRQIRS